MDPNPLLIIGSPTAIYI